MNSLGEQIWLPANLNALIDIYESPPYNIAFGKLAFRVLVYKFDKTTIDFYRNRLEDKAFEDLSKVIFPSLPKTAQ